MSSPLGARKCGKFKAISTAPSINKTPMGSSTPPVPYPVSHDLSNSIGIVPHVKLNGDPIYVLDQSTQPKCIGDNPGTAGGVKSGTYNGEVKPTSSSGHVKITRKKAVRVGDTCTLNKGNCPGVYVSEPAPAAPGSNSNPPATPETPEEKGYLEKAGDLLGKLDIKALRNLKDGINKRIDNMVASSGYNPAVMVIGSIGVAASEVFVPESVLDFTPGKLIGLGKKGLKLAKNAVKAEKVLKALSKEEKLVLKAEKLAKKEANAAKKAAKKAAKSDGIHVKKEKYRRSKSERRKALKRDAKDPNSKLTKEQRDYIKEHDGNKVPKDCEVSHDTPLYTEKTIEGKKSLDTADNMTTMPKNEHRDLHKTCGASFHDFPR
jgi:hypothetical protein